MALHTSLAWAIAALGTVLGAGGPAAAQGTAAPSVPVTVYDAWMEPYTSYGRAQAGGAVIVFDQAPLGPETGRPAVIAPGFDAALPGPVSGPIPGPVPAPAPAPVTVIGVPLEPPAGEASSPPPEPLSD